METQKAPDSPKFHVAISYASEDERYAEEVADLLRRDGITVFFAKWEQPNLLGQNLAIVLPTIFSQEAHHCLLFVSNHYASKTYTIHEWNAIAARSFKDRKYLIPARLDDAELDGLLPTLAYADVRPRMSPAQLASLITNRLSTGGLIAPSCPRASNDLSPFIGRRNELRRATHLLRKKSVCILVLHGEGGTGKTRLAQHLVEQLRGEFGDGARTVLLRTVWDPGLVPGAIARSLGLREAEDIPVQEMVKQHLRTRHMLLLLDNFEHLSSAGAYVHELVKECPGLKVLITSRRPLNDPEMVQNFHLPPLSLPVDGELTGKRLMQSDAVALFQQHASLVDPDFKAVTYGREVVEICEILGGIALAIEVTAARINWYKPPEMLDRLKQYLKGEGDAGLPLREMMHASLDWSYSLLSPDEQVLFRRLSVFAGGCTTDEARAICGGGLEIDVRVGLERLSDMSLLRRDPESTGPSRFCMLDIIREYALERLKASQE
jgi:predicted ATPase